MSSPWLWWSPSGRCTTPLPPPCPGLIRPRTAFTASAGRTPTPALPDAGQGSGQAHAPFNPPSDNRAHRLPGHRHLGVPDSFGARDSSHRRADDRDCRRPSWGGDSAGHNGRSRRGQGTDRTLSTSRRHGTGHRRNRGQGNESSSDGRSRRYRPRGDASQASSSSSSTDGSGKAPVPEVSTSSKRLVVLSMADVASSAALLGCLAMPDDRAMPVSSNLAHARTTAIDSAAATPAKKHTADVRAYNTWD